MFCMNNGVDRIVEIGCHGADFTVYEDLGSLPTEGGGPERSLSELKVDHSTAGSSIADAVFRHRNYSHIEIRLGGNILPTMKSQLITL